MHRKTGVGYENQCVVCEDNSIVCKYAGETGKTRGNDYVKEFDKKNAD